MEVLAVIETVSIALSAVSHIFKRCRDLIQSYGPTIGLTVGLFARSTAAEHSRIRKVVLHGDDETVMSFRQSVTDECNMTAVAVSNHLPASLQSVCSYP